MAHPDVQTEDARLASLRSDILRKYSTIAEARRQGNKKRLGMRGKEHHQCLNVDELIAGFADPDDVDGNSQDGWIIHDQVQKDEPRRGKSLPAEIMNNIFVWSLHMAANEFDTLFALRASWCVLEYSVFPL
ncbi:uncharacterized protein FTOL_10526 [Fusarium torulosum]|uniref:Uncharacterized protein n=1 Tax=Fusarium torulosum TaxID=33205 RepID=A0AAE8SM40_9HYPO|nr:uncharacterized protein FTOL_10526 [Fusarium torulosum]